MSGRDHHAQNVAFRGFAAKAGLFALACVAAWNFVVRPQNAGVRQGEAALAKAGAEVAALEASASGSAELDALERALASDRQRMYDAVALAAEPAKIYEKLRHEASKAGVTIQSIEPLPSRQVSRASGQSAQEPRAESFGYSLEVTGRFDSIAGFIESCEQSLGAAKVSELRITPTGTTPQGQQPVLRASVDVLLVKLTPPSDDTKTHRSSP